MTLIRFHVSLEELLMQNPIPEYLQVVADKIEALESEIKRLETEEINLQQELSRANDINNALEETTRVLENDKVELLQKCEIEKQGLRELNSVVSEQLRGASEESIGNVREELAAAQMEINRLKHELSSQKIISEALKEKSQHLGQATTEPLNMSVHEASESAQTTFSEDIDEETAQKLEALINEKEALQRDLRHWQRSVKNLEVEKGALEDQNKQLQELQLQAGEDKLSISAKHRVMRDENLQLQADKARLIEERDQLLENKSELEYTNNELGEQNAHLKHENDELTHKNSVLHTANTSLTQEVQALNDRVAHLSAESDSLRKGNEYLTNEHAKILQKSKMLAEINNNLVSESLAVELETPQSQEEDETPPKQS